MGILPADWSTGPADMTYTITLAKQPVTASNPKGIFPALGQETFTSRPCPRSLTIAAHCCWINPAARGSRVKRPTSRIAGSDASRGLPWSSPDCSPSGRPCLLFFPSSQSHDWCALHADPGLDSCLGFH